jgi:hypothetical protein
LFMWPTCVRASGREGERRRERAIASRIIIMHGWSTRRRTGATGLKTGERERRERREIESRVGSYKNLN